MGGLFDCAREVVKGHEHLYDMAKLMADFVVPQEFGFNDSQKVSGFFLF